MLTKLQTKWKELDRTITVNQRELVLGLAVCALAGAVLGLFFSPRKTPTFGSYNGCNNTVPGEVKLGAEDEEE